MIDLVYYLSVILFEAIVIFLLGTILFDIVHFAMHQCMKSKSHFLRKIGQLHHAHHRFYTNNLIIEKAWQQKNLKHHVILEYGTQIIGILICASFVPPLAVYLALFYATCIFLLVCYNRGIDLHHKTLTHLYAYNGSPWVSANYHALHHIYLNNFYSSYIKIIDYFLGSAVQLAGKRIAMTGANGALGSNMKILLEQAGAHVTTFKYGVDYDYQDYAQLKTVLETTDILFLCHGSKYEHAQQANCDSFVAIIELYRQVHKKQLVPPEIWAVGSEIECHPCFGIKKLYPYARSKRNYASYARSYYHNPEIQYRHLVHSAFTSDMGKGLITARFAARCTIFMLRRGFKYVPVTYTGFAILNYLRFIFYDKRLNKAFIK